MDNVVNRTKAYLLEFENSEYHVDCGNLQYVLASQKPTIEELMKVDYIRDFMETYDFNIITNIEELNEHSLYYNREWFSFEEVYNFVTSYPWLFRS